MLWCQSFADYVHTFQPSLNPVALVAATPCGSIGFTGQLRLQLPLACIPHPYCANSSNKSALDAYNTLVKYEALVQFKVLTNFS